MTRKRMKSYLSVSLTMNICIIIQLIWELLEIWIYGAVTPRLVDTFIGVIMFLTINALMPGVVDKIEDKYAGCIIEEAKARRKSNG